MIRIFKIIEKVVGAMVILAIIIVLALMAIAITNNADSVWNDVKSYMPLLYSAAMIFVAFKAVIVGMQMYLEMKIEEKTKHLQAVIEEQQEQQTTQKTNMSNKLDKIINDITTIPNTDTSTIVDFLKSNLPNVVSTLVEQQVNQQVAYEKQKLALEYEQKESELKRKWLTVEAIAERQDRIEKLNKAIQLREQQEREKRMKNTEEYTMLVFSLAKTPVEDVEKVWQVTKLFLESSHVLADKDSKIALNKNLRNSELKQFALNIVKYNRKENLDVESYLMTVFGEWFTGKKENISKNYNTLPKDSLVSKDGVKEDLELLRKEYTMFQIEYQVT